MKYEGYMVGSALRKLRMDRGLSVLQASNLTGMSTSSINQIEQGGRNLSMKSLFIFMDTYGVDANNMWNHFIRDTLGKRKIKDVKYSEILYFYNDLVTNQGMAINTLETINTILRTTFQLAVRDNIIRKNPVDGAYCEIKKRNGGSRKTRRALTVEQQRAFMGCVK